MNSQMKRFTGEGPEGSRAHEPLSPRSWWHATSRQSSEALSSGRFVAPRIESQAPWLVSSSFPPLLGGGGWGLSEGKASDMDLMGKEPASR